MRRTDTHEASLDRLFEERLVAPRLQLPSAASTRSNAGHLQTWHDRKEIHKPGIVTLQTWHDRKKKKHTNPESRQTDGLDAGDVGRWLVGTQVVVANIATDQAKHGFFLVPSTAHNHRASNSTNTAIAQKARARTSEALPGSGSSCPSSSLSESSDSARRSEARVRLSFRYLMACNQRQLVRLQCWLCRALCCPVVLLHFTNIDGRKKPLGFSELLSD
jgi:hypothetical protein